MVRRSSGAAVDRSSAGGGRSTSQSERQLLWLLVRASNQFKSSADQVLARAGLTQPQFAALQRLRMTESRSMRDLAAELHCDASNLTGIVDRLEERGLVERRVDPRDRRIKNLVLTETGRVLADEVWDEAVASSPIIALPEAVKSALLEALEAATPDGT